MSARELVICCFTHSGRLSGSSSGLAILLSCWLDMPLPRVRIRDGRYVITCASKRDAQKLCSSFGGVVDGERVSGAIVDLTS